MYSMANYIGLLNFNEILVRIDTVTLPGKIEVMLPQGYQK